MTGFVYTPAMLNRLRTEYRRAVERGAERFTFEGHTLVCDYAKYVIEYLEMQFERHTGERK